MRRGDEQVGSASEQIIHVSGVGLGATSERFVQIAMAHGYTVVASGPNRFRLARTYRPKWATVAAIGTAVFVGLGLLFLLVKRVETGEAVIAEERAGIRVRLTGELLPSLVETLSLALAAPAPALTAPALAAPALTAPLAQFPASGPSSGAPSLAVAAFAPAMQAVPAQPVVRATPEAMLVFGDGRLISVGRGGVLGRDPSADPAVPDARMHPLADPSLSKTHLSFGPLPRGVWVVDHHSTNGTVVASGGVTATCAPGVRVEVPFGAQVVAGDVSFVVGSR